MLFHWSKFNGGLKSLKLIFKPFQFQQIDVNTLGKRIKNVQILRWRVFTVTATDWLQRSALYWKIIKSQKVKQRCNVESVYGKRQRV